MGGRLPQRQQGFPMNYMDLDDGQQERLSLRGKVIYQTPCGLVWHADWGRRGFGPLSCAGCTTFKSLTLSFLTWDTCGQTPTFCRWCEGWLCLLLRPVQCRRRTAPKPAARVTASSALTNRIKLISILTGKYLPSMLGLEDSCDLIKALLTPSRFESDWCSWRTHASVGIV